MPQGDTPANPRRRRGNEEGLLPVRKPILETTWPLRRSRPECWDSGRLYGAGAAKFLDSDRDTVLKLCVSQSVANALSQVASSPQAAGK